MDTINQYFGHIHLLMDNFLLIYTVRSTAEAQAGVVRLVQSRAQSVGFAWVTDTVQCTATVTATPSLYIAGQFPI